MINVICRWHCAELWIPFWIKVSPSAVYRCPLCFIIIFDKWFLMWLFGISVGLTQCRAQHCPGITLHSGLRLSGGDCSIRSARRRIAKYQNLRIVGIKLNQTVCPNRQKPHFTTYFTLPVVFPVHEEGVHKGICILCSKIQVASG